MSRPRRADSQNGLVIGSNSSYLTALECGTLLWRRYTVEFSDAIKRLYPELLIFKHNNESPPQSLRVPIASYTTELEKVNSG